MNFLKLCTCFFGFFALAAQPLAAQQFTLQADSLILCNYLTQVSEDRLYLHIAILASDSLGGRKAGEEGMKLAEQYLANQYTQFGLRSPTDETYQQPFTIYDGVYKSQIISNGEKSATIFPIWDGSLQESGELVFVGQGTEKDYNGLQTKDKVVAYYYSDERDFKSEDQNKIASANDTKQTLTIHKTATTYQKALEKSHHWSPRASLENKGDQGRKALLFNIMEEDFLMLYSPEQQKLIQAYNETGKLSGKNKRSLTQTVSLNLDYQTLPIQAANIIGVVEGSDLKEEVIVLSAHYDHLGAENGKVYHGADDNASGAAAVLELARLFAQAKEEGNGPRRTLVFAQFSAEEEGLLGADYYVQHPLYPLENTVANLNFDMVGRVSEFNKENPDYVYVIGGGEPDEEIYQLNAQSQQSYLPQLRLYYTFNGTAKGLYKRSDQYLFIKNGIPALFFTDQMEADYHQATDTADKIDLRQLKLRTQLGFATAWELANRD